MNQPNLPSPFFRKFMIVFAAIICVFYLAYRAIFTFNLSTSYAVFASVFLYVGEFFGIMNLLLYFLQVWEVTETPAQPVLEGRTVDVLVPTYNEDPALLRATLEACIRMDYPHKTYVLDDGRRPEVETLAKELGVIYVSRPDNRHAKAGNLNNALEQTNGEFVVVLDADHVPEPHFITRLIGYFHDDQLAFVQTPHAFYNFDSFQARLDHKNRRYWEEGDLFYRVIQPGRNKWNAPIFAGSAAMFRRDALKEIGYIATETITEDMHTGLRLHSRGWKSLAVSERLVAGQAPPDITTFHSQRLRWGEGNLSIMAYDNPLTARGLTLAQRFCYFGSMIHWAGGLFKLAIYLTPILMLFSGVPPVKEFSWDLIVVTLTYLFFSLYAMKVVSNGYGSIINSELFSMVNFWTQTKATFRAIFRRKRQRFVVTQKGPGKGVAKSVWPFVRPQTYLIILSVLAICWGWLRLSLDLNPIRAFVRMMHRFNLNFSNGLANAIEGLIDGTILNHPLVIGFGISDDYFKPVVPTIWCLIFFWLAYKVTQRAFWPADRRFTIRHQVHLPIEYEIITAKGTAIHYGVTVDLNDSGMSIAIYDDLPMHAVLRFTVRGAGETVKLRGEIRSVTAVVHGHNSDGYRYGIQFKDLTSPQVDAINRICLHYAVPRMFDQYERGNRDTFWNRMKLWQSRGMAQRRNAVRNAFHLPLIVNTGTTEETTVFSSTEDISRVAVAAMFDSDIPVGSNVGFLMPTPLGEIRGTATVIRSQQEMIAGRPYYRCVMEWKEFEGQGRTTIQSLVNPSENTALKPILKPDRKTFLPKMRVPIVVGLLIAIPLIMAQMGIIFPFYYKEDQFLKKMIDTDKPSDFEVREYDRILEETLKDPHPSTDRLVLLMTLGNKLGAKNDIERVTLYLAVRDQRNLKLSRALVVAYDNTQKYAEAEKEYNRLMALGNRGYLGEADKKELKFAGARVAVHAGRYEDAMKRFKELHEEDPNNQELRNEYAGVCNTSGHYDVTIKVLESGPIDVEGRKRLIAAYYQLGKYGDAAEHANKLVAETKDSSEALQIKADIEGASQNYEQQIKILEQLRTRQAERPDPEILVRLAYAYNSKKMYEEAIDVTTPLFDRNDFREGATDAFINAASQVRGIEKKFEPYDAVKADRIRKYANMLDKHAANMSSESPNFAIYLSRLGWVLQRLGESDRSSEVVRRALTILPNNEQVRQQLASILLQAGKTEAAMLALGNPNSREARKLLIGIHLENAAQQTDLALKNKKFDEALQLSRAIYADEHTWENEKFIANILSWKGGDGSFAEAIKIYEKHLQEFPADTDAEAHVAEITLWAKFYGDAVAKYQALLDPDNRFKQNAMKYGDGFINAASSAKELTPAQITIAEKLVDLKMKNQIDDPAVISRLAWVMLKAKNRDKAEDLLKKVKITKEMKPEVKKEIAGVFAEAGLYKSAIEALDNPQTDVERLALAKLHSGAKDWAPAIVQINAVIANKPADQELLREAKFLLADVYSYKGEHPKAIEEFGRLKLEYPAEKTLPIREAEVTLWAKQYDKALLMFQALYDKTPAEPKVWFGFASAVSMLGANNSDKKVKPLIPENYANTIRRIAQRVIDAPAVADTLLWARLAVAMQYTGDAQKADLFITRALEMKNRDPVVRRELANSLTVLRRFKDAIEMYKGITLDRDDRLRLIDIATSAENLDLAVSEARALVLQDPTNKLDKKTLADVLSWRGDFSESLALYEQLVKDQPKDQDLMLKIADVTIWWRNYPEALVKFGELLTTRGEEARVYLGFIDAASSAPTLSPGHVKQALDVYDNYMKDKTKITDPVRLTRLAWVMIRTDKGKKADDLTNYGEKADNLLNRALAMKPTDTETRRELAGVLAGRDRIKEAIAMFSLIEDEMTFEDRINYAILLSSGGTRENLDEAEKQFRKLIGSNERPKDAKVRRSYAEMMLWNGKYDKKHFALAQMEFESLHKDFPKDDWLAVRVAQSLLWSGQYSASLPKFQDLMDLPVISDDRMKREIWMGYVDAAAGSVGDLMRKAALSDEQPDKPLAAFFNEKQRRLMAKAYQQADAVRPDAPTEKSSDRALSEIRYYCESLGRLGLSLGLLGDKERSREIFEKAISMNRANKEIWLQYAQSLTHQKEFQKARLIFNPLIDGRIPDELPR